MVAVDVELGEGAVGALIRKGLRITGWTFLMLILTLLFLAITEGSGFWHAITSIQSFPGFLGLGLCVATALIIETLLSMQRS
jgi:hypothetical protein